MSFDRPRSWSGPFPAPGYHGCCWLDSSTPPDAFGHPCPELGFLAYVQAGYGIVDVLENSLNRGQVWLLLANLT